MAVLPDMIGIVAKDVGASLRFYRLLGLAIPEGVEEENYVEVTSPNGYRISWNSAAMMKSILPEWQDPTGHKIELAFKCDTPDEVDKIYQQLIEAGNRSCKSPWDAFWGQHYAIIYDPDENPISLFSPLKIDGNTVNQ